MKKIITFVISVLLVFTTCFNKNCYALESLDIIDHILNDDKDSKENDSALNKIYDILNRKDNLLPSNKSLEVIDNKASLEAELKKNNNRNILPTNKKVLKGIDVSKWDGDIDWKKVKKAGIDFAIIRAGYGQNSIDYKFRENIEGAYKNGIIVGIYWFSYAYNTNMAKNEAKKCMEILKIYKNKITMPVFFDFEYDSMDHANKHGVTLNKNEVSDIAETFCHTITKGGYRCGIYTNLDYVNRYFKQDVLNKYDVWIAQWTSTCTYKHKYIMWQYSSTGRVPGITTNVDMNLYYNK